MNTPKWPENCPDTATLWVEGNDSRSAFVWAGWLLALGLGAGLLLGVLIHTDPVGWAAQAVHAAQQGDAQ